MPRLEAVKERYQGQVHEESKRLMTNWAAELARAAQSGEPAA